VGVDGEDMSATQTSSSEGQLCIELEITGITGDENRSTIDAANAHLVPMLRAHGIRLLQVARGGQSTHDGYDILADWVRLYRPDLFEQPSPPR
jgi:hypothetical protein